MKGQTSQRQKKSMQHIDRMQVVTLKKLEKNVTQCMEAVSQLQQEFILACKSTMDNTLASQHEMITKSGLGSNLPQSYLKSINDATEEFVKNSSLQNKAIITAIDASKQNIKTFRDNFKTFTTMDPRLIQPWFSAWKPSRNP